ncbi:MAG: hypothetical protein J0G99_08490 [Alphaproteobacteria bacterium]|nr:hypothetical protein [Alphaproteobacteria bacterium]
MSLPTNPPVNLGAFYTDLIWEKAFAELNAIHAAIARTVGVRHDPIVNCVDGEFEGPRKWAIVMLEFEQPGGGQAHISASIECKNEVLLFGFASDQLLLEELEIHQADVFLPKLVAAVQRQLGEQSNKT